jgi:hypothetical protein
MVRMRPIVDSGDGQDLSGHRRAAVLFCALSGPPKIVRLHGRGTAIEPHDDEFAPLAKHFANAGDPMARSIIRIEVTRISDSCGYGVPRFRYEGDRDQLTLWAERKGAEGLKTYQAARNAESIDGLDALRWVKSRA